MHVKSVETQTSCRWCGGGKKADQKAKQGAESSQPEVHLTLRRAKSIITPSFLLQWHDSRGGLAFSRSLFQASLLPASVLQFLVLKTRRSFTRPSIHLRFGLPFLRVQIGFITTYTGKNFATAQKTKSFGKPLLPLATVGPPEASCECRYCCPLSLTIRPDFLGVYLHWTGLAADEAWQSWQDGWQLPSPKHWNG
ncbi:hypothetical protein TNCV_1084091 [Trichonephila clavipes]|nr:hypothetical protein TNCV_1084091 [Trichonephila clavipes]